jgi:hypothetical protein
MGLVLLVLLLAERTSVITYIIAALLAKAEMHNYIYNNNIVVGHKCTPEYTPGQQMSVDDAARFHFVEVLGRGRGCR